VVPSVGHHDGKVDEDSESHYSDHGPTEDHALAAFVVCRARCCENKDKECVKEDLISDCKVLHLNVLPLVFMNRESKHENTAAN